MNIPQAQIISEDFAKKLISEALMGELALSYDRKKHQILIENNQHWLVKIYLPWTMDWSPSKGILANPDPHFSLVLIRAGQSSVGYFHRGILIDHKVFRAYMVRQKQGVSQLNI